MSNLFIELKKQQEEIGRKLLIKPTKELFDEYNKLFTKISKLQKVKVDKNNKITLNKSDKENEIENIVKQSKKVVKANELDLKEKKKA
jgi:hypothetical protein